MVKSPDLPLNSARSLFQILYYLFSLFITVQAKSGLTILPVPLQAYYLAAKNSTTYPTRDLETEITK